MPAVGRVLPEHWPADLLAGTAGCKGAGPWTTCSLTGLDSHSIRPMPDAFLPGLKPDIPRYAMPRLNYHIAGSGCPAGGWIALSDVPGHPCEENTGALHVATVRVTTPGVWSFNIHSEDHSALCIGGQNWSRHVRSTGGAGQMKDDTLWEEEPVSCGANTQNAGAITLKKGEYPIEVLYADIYGPSILSVFTSPSGYPPRLLARGGARCWNRTLRGCRWWRGSESHLRPRTPVPESPPRCC